MNNSYIYKEDISSTPLSTSIVIISPSPFLQHLNPDNYQANKDFQNADHPYSQPSLFEGMAGELILWIISLFKEGGL